MEVRGMFRHASQSRGLERAFHGIGLGIFLAGLFRSVAQNLAAPEIGHGLVEADSHVMEKCVSEQWRQMAERAIRLVGIAENIETFNHIVPDCGFVSRLVLVPR